MNGDSYFEVRYFTSMEAFLGQTYIYREFYRCHKSYCIALANLTLKNKGYFSYEIVEK